MRSLFVLIFFLICCCKAYGQDETLKLNHIYFVLDAATFEKIKSNKELIAWGNWDKGLPNFDPIDQKNTTAYLRGKSTYLEIMGPDNKFGEKKGAVGIGFSWDVHGQFSDDLAKKQKNEGLKFERSESKWDFGTGKMLWYSSYYTKLKGSVATWYAFYNPDFLSNLYRKPYTSFTREDFLRNRSDNTKLITDISGMVLDCSSADYDKIIEEMTAFGIRKKASGKTFIIFDVDSIDIRLHLTNREKTAIRELRLKTQAQPAENFTIENLEFKNTPGELVIKFN